MRNVLLAVTGMSPQVVTETLYAIHCCKKPMPDAVYLITTEVGKDQAWLTLGVGRDGGVGKLEQFCIDYGYQHISFDSENIWVVKDQSGKPLKDVNTHEEHRAVADFITSKVAKLTQDDDVLVHASLAGGRKTMTFFLGYAMSLYARENDILTHVLVSEGYESLADFFYPTPYDLPIQNRSGKILNARDAIVTLAEIPFVRMRQEVPEQLLSGESQYSTVVDVLNRGRNEPKLHLITSKCLLICDGQSIKLPPKRFALYRWLAWRAQQNLCGIPTPTELGDDTYIDEIFFHYEITTDSFKADEQRIGQLKNGFTKQAFEQHKSKINRVIRDKMGKSWGGKFTINPLSFSSGRKVFGISLDPKNITIQ